MEEVVALGAKGLPKVNLKSCSINVSLAGILLMSGVLPPIAELSCKPIRSKAQLSYASTLMTNDFFTYNRNRPGKFPGLFLLYETHAMPKSFTEVKEIHRVNFLFT